MSSPSNPYLPPQETPDKTGVANPSYIRLRQRVWLAVYMYPVIGAIALYTTWLIAWTMLGHMPRPMLDDPTSLGLPMIILFPATAFAVVLIPATVPLGIAACFIHPVSCSGNNWLRMARRLFIYALLCVAVWSLLQADPGRVLEWYID